MPLELRNSRVISTLYSSTHNLQADVVIGEKSGKNGKTCFVLFTNRERYPLTSDPQNNGIVSYNAKYVWDISESRSIEYIICANNHKMPAEDLAPQIVKILKKNGVSKDTICKVENCSNPKSLLDNIVGLTTTVVRLINGERILSIDLHRFYGE